MAQVLMVSGDIGGAKIQLPVCKKLIEQGISVRVIVDAHPKAKGRTVWEKAGIPFEEMFYDNQFEDAIYGADLIFAGSCATAYYAESWAICVGKAFNKLTVIGSDMWFNHARKPWREATPDFWLAIDEVHQKDILKLRPGLLPDRVPILGQPAFDDLPELIANKEQIRKDIRAKLNIIDDERVLLYWSPGDNTQRCTEGFNGLLAGIEALKTYTDRPVYRPIVIPRIHPKMKEVIGQEFYRYWQRVIANSCEDNKCRLIWAADIDPQELNLAADTVLSQWSTESIKSAICKVPTINALLSEFRDFLENELGQEKPYIPTVKCNAAIGAFSLSEIQWAIQNTMFYGSYSEMAANGEKMMPSGNSAEQIARFLKNLL